MSRGRRRGAVLVILLLVLSAGCSKLAGSMEIANDENLQSGLLDLSATGGAGRLADLTDFEWDTVYVFSEGAAAADIEAAVGQPVIDDEFYYEAGNLLIFVRGGEPVRAVSVLPDVLVTGGQARWSADVSLQPRGDTRPASLILVEA